MALSPALFSSENEVWETPLDVFHQLNHEFGFETDVCALPDNAKCANYYTPEIDGLKQDWSGVCWMNPPYGKTIELWMSKAYEASLKGATVVCLVPARTDTAWFHDWVLGKAEIRWIRGRLRFGAAKDSAPFPSMVAIYRPRGTP